MDSYDGVALNRSSSNPVKTTGLKVYFGKCTENCLDAATGLEFFKRFYLNTFYIQRQVDFQKYGELPVTPFNQFAFATQLKLNEFQYYRMPLRHNEIETEDEYI